MGIVNAFVNQIGREAARDVYRGRSNRSSIRTVPDVESYIPFNDRFLAEIKNFKITSTSSQTLNQLVNIVENAENTAIDNFEWEDIFIEIDNKIDFCRVELGDNSSNKLGELDKKNAENFIKKKGEHKEYVLNLIKVQTQTQSDLNRKKPFIAFLLSLIGLNPIYYNQSSARIVLFVFITFISFVSFYFGYNLKVYPQLYMEGSDLSETKAIKVANSVANLAFVLGGLFYALILTSSFKKINAEHQKKVTIDNNIDLFNRYLIAFNKT